MIDKVLMDRERRYDRILELIGEFNLPVLCGKINYPGKNKNTMESMKAFSILKEFLSVEFIKKAVFCEKVDGYDGCSMLMVLSESPLAAKNRTVHIEEQHTLGRIFDIDIYIKDGSSIGRENINKSPRRCILCNGDARICMKYKNHNLEDVLEKINGLINTSNG